jgi:hypothetical protein
VCRGSFPCRVRTCDGRDINRKQIPNEWPGVAPRRAMLKSLGMKAELTRGEDGKLRWKVWAPWLGRGKFVEADTWEEAYWKAVRGNVDESE